MKSEKLKSMNFFIFKEKMVKKHISLSLVILSIFLFIALVSASITFTDPTPATGSQTTNASTIINLSISDPDLQSFNFTWDGTTISHYDASLITMFNFDNLSSLGESSTLLADLGIYSLNGTINDNLGNSQVAGKHGYTYNWSVGVNHNIVVPNVETKFSSELPVSIAMWVYDEDPLVSGVYADTSYDGNGDVDWGGWLLFHYSTNGYIRWAFESVTGGVQELGFTNCLVTGGQWQYIVLTANSTTGSAYLDGQLCGTGTFSITPALNNGTDSLWIGERGDSWSSFTGSIDEFRLYNKTLSSSEITDMYNSYLDKTNSTQWYFLTNQTSTGEHNYTYQASYSNSTDSLSTSLNSLISNSVNPLISFGANSQANDTRTVGGAYINISIQDDSLTSITHTINSVDYSLFNSSLKLLYNFNNVSSLGEDDSTIVNVANYENNGTPVNMDLGWNSTGGKYGDGAYEFFGDNDQINVDNTNGALNDSSFTWSLWFEYNDNNPNKADFGEGLIEQRQTANRMALFMFNNGTNQGRMYFATYNASGTGSSITSNAIFRQPNKWYHVAVTYDDSTRTASMYKDGELITSAVMGYTGSIRTDYTYNTLIGKALATYGNFLNGSVDDVMYWGRVLSADEIDEVYHLRIVQEDPQNYSYILNHSDWNPGLNYTYNASVTDSVSNSNQTETRIYGDFDAPTINIVTPSNNTASTNKLFIDVNYTYSETNFYRCYYVTDNPNKPVYFTCGNNFSAFFFSSGTGKNLTVTLTDVAGRSVSQTISNLSFTMPTQANSCDGKESWIQNAISYEVADMKHYSETDRILDSFEDGIPSTTTKGNVGDGVAHSTAYYPTSPNSNSLGSMAFTYNVSNPTYNWMYLNKQGGGDWDLSNMTGLGFWFKGDGTNNTLGQFQLYDSITGTEWVTSSFATDYDSGDSIHMDSTDWKYIYIDFKFYKNKTGGQDIPQWALANISRIYLQVSDGGYSEPTGTVYFSDLRAVDYDKGSMFFTRWRDGSTNVSGRWQEGLYNLAYQYKYGTHGYAGNQDIRNAVVEGMDWLARNQLWNGGWLAEDGTSNHGSSAGTGFVGIPMVKTLDLMKDDAYLNDYVNERFHENITNQTRGALWNASAETMANYTLIFTFPAGWVTNQYFGHLHATWLYANYSGKWNIYNDTINSQLATINNTWQLNTFGFTPESNTTGKIGIDWGYNHVTTFVEASFYLDSLNPTLSDIINKHGESFKNTVNDGHTYMLNGSRGSTGSNGVYDSYVWLASNMTGDPYIQQLVYLTNVYGAGTGSSANGNSLTGGLVPYRSTYWATTNWLYCSVNVTDPGFRFPQNYTHIAYDLMSETSWDSRNTDLTGNFQTISQLQFPRILFAWDDNNTWWKRGDNLTTFSDYLTTNSSGWMYSDENGNFSLPVTPKIKITIGDSNVQVITQNGTAKYNTTRSDLFNNSGDFIQMKAYSEVDVYGLTDALIFLQNGTVIGSTNISANDGNINYTQSGSNNHTIILDKINLTEGSARTNSPFWVSSRTDDGKTVTYHLASNLSDSIDGLVFYPQQTIKCGSASYSSNSGDTANVAPTVACSGGYVSSVTINDYEPATGSNTLTITYGSGSDGGGGGSNVGGQSGSNSTTDGFYNRTFLCEESLKFIEFYTKNGVLNYTLDEYNAFKNKIVLLQSFGIEDAVLKPFIDDFENECPGFVTDENGNPINIGGSSDGEGFNYTYLWIGLFVLVILIVIILIVMGGNAHKDRTMLMAGLFQRNKYDPSNP